MMEVVNGILNRQSIRNFDPKQRVSEQDIETLLKCACQAPSAMNKQSWSFIVVTDEQILATLQNFQPYAGYFKDAGTVIAVVADSENCWEDSWRVDSILAGENILLAAEDLGLATCWCGVYPNPNYMQSIAQTLNIPEPFKPITLIAVGYAAGGRPRVLPRYNPSKIHRNKW